MNPSCYVVPAAEMQEVMALLIQLPILTLLGYFTCRAVLDWDEYLWQWRRTRRFLRVRRRRLLSQEFDA